VILTSLLRSGELGGLAAARSPYARDCHWQRIASACVDPQPAFRRVYNSTLCVERYDPEGEHMREYVPEIRLVSRRRLGESA